MLNTGVGQDQLSQSMESPLALPRLPLPIASVSTKYEELPSSEIDKSKLAPITVVLRKYSALYRKSNWHVKQYLVKK